VPAESRLGCFARLEAHLDFLRAVGRAPSALGRRPRGAAGPSLAREHRVQQLARRAGSARGSRASSFSTMSLIASAPSGFSAARAEELALHQPIEIGRRRRVLGQHAGQHLIHRHASEVDVGAKTALPWKLLGRHVRRAADQVVPCAAISRKREVPKSATLSRPRSRRARSKAQSRWMTPCLCAWSTVVADLARVVERARHVERPSRAMIVSSVSRARTHHDEETFSCLLGSQNRHDVG